MDSGKQIFCKPLSSDKTKEDVNIGFSIIKQYELEASKDLTTFSTKSVFELLAVVLVKNAKVFVEKFGLILSGLDIYVDIYDEMDWNQKRLNYKTIEISFFF